MCESTRLLHGSGPINSEVGNHEYGDGTIVSIKAAPDSGWQFDSWSGNVADSDLAETTLTMTADETVTVNFSPITPATNDTNDEARPNWWLIGGIIAAAIGIGMIIWLAVRSVMA